MQKERPGGGIGILYEVFENHQRVTLLSLLIKGAGQPELGRQAVRGKRERFAKFLFCLVRFAPGRAASRRDVGATQYCWAKVAALREALAKRRRSMAQTRGWCSCKYSCTEFELIGVCITKS